MKKRGSSPRFFIFRIGLLTVEVERNIQSNIDGIIVFRAWLVLEDLHGFDRAFVETGAQTLFNFWLGYVALFVDDDAHDHFTGNVLLLRLVRISGSRSLKQTWSCDLVGKFVNLLRSRLCRQHAYGGDQHQRQNDEDLFHNAPSHGVFLRGTGVIPHLLWSGFCDAAHIDED